MADLAPGDPLPSDAELCEEFGVSRMTARNAVQRLSRTASSSGSPAAGRSSPSRRRTARPAT